tara:strand:- start:1890 stop:2138 length:249 start_codon:yes stop_codon:yes gene_type:complete
MFQVLEKFYSAILPEDEHFNMNNKMAKIIPAILAMITVQILLLFFGKYLWNNFLVKKVTGIKPLESVLELVAISILLKLLVN